MDIPAISAQEVKRALDNYEEVVLLDVRTPAEYARGKIKGSINLPVDEISAKVESVIPDKKSRVFVYCLSASRSPLAVTIMQQLGYTQVYNMTSGLLAWRINKYPTGS